MAGLGGGESVERQPPPGARGTASAPSSKSWSSIASMNISKRNKTNTLEVRLENDEGNGCSLNEEEIERLLRRLKIQSNQFTSVQACPERRNVVYITLAMGIDITRFIINNNESFVLKQGIRTTTVKPVNKREVNIQVFGLHPDTKDEAVIRYLSAHGKINTKLPVTYGVYPGAPGSSLLAGKRNGNRTYSMEVKKNIGSSHIIDGEKVSIRYPGQTKTCNKCHKQANICLGKGLAKNCSSEKILLSQHMISYWQQIDFKPETTSMNEVDIEEETEAGDDVPKTIDQAPKAVTLRPDINSNYGGVVIEGYGKDIDMEEAIETLKEAGLPFNYAKEDLHITERFEKLTIYIHDLKSEACVEIVNNLHGQEKAGKKLTVYALVEDTPTKHLGEELEKLMHSDQTTNNEPNKSPNTPPSSYTMDIPTLITPVKNTPGLNTPVKNISASNVARSDLFNELEILTDPELSKASKFWSNHMDDIHLSDDSSDDEMKANREAFKRKAEGSPEKNNADKLLSRKEKKKLKQLLNKSS